MITYGTEVRSLRNGATGRVVGFGAIEWPDYARLHGDKCVMKQVFLVQIRDGSSALGPACAVFRVDQTEEIQ